MAHEPKVPTKVDEASEQPGRGKKHYQSPTLRRLGTVRELTLSGGTASARDNPFNAAAMKKSM